jgi:type VI secretion system secreted protein VgrG
MPYTQDEKLISIKTPLGKDVLLLTGIRGTEEISRLFDFELAMISEKHDISFDAIVGKNVTVSVVLADGSSRYFNGIVSSFSQGRGGGENGGVPQFSFYRATLVPTLWLLTQTSDMRIFQNKSTPDIIDKVFKDQGFKDYCLKLQGSYPKRDYCVQYRETDFNFVSRLMEEEGIHYFFEHEDGKHIMVIGDSPSGHKPCPGQKSASYHLSGEGLLEEDIITSLEMSKQIRVGKYSLADYNFEIPNTDLTAVVPSNTKLGPGEREVYDYPGLYGKKSDGDRLAKVRMEEEEAQITKILGGSSCRAFTSGYKFTLTDHFRRDLNNKDYLLVSVTHEAVEGYSADAEPTYRNSFECIPHEVPFRPLRSTPKPFVKGAQTAIVVGPSGEEIYPDEHGRVKVQFHWDREGKKDDKSSCWMRVSQVHAGAGFGGIDIPRIGEEVIVSFVEGNPDRPIITGRVYHGTNRPPTGLPAAGMVSGLKSNSTPGGGGCNEMTMNDTKGKEAITIHGQYNMGTTVENDKTLTVHNNRTSTIDVNDTLTVGANQTIDVKANLTQTVGSNHSVTVHANQANTVMGKLTETVSSNHSTTIGGKQSETVTGSSTITVASRRMETVGGGHMFTNPRMAMNVGGKCMINAGGSITQSSPKVNLQAGSKLTANSGGPVTVKAGGVIQQQSGGTYSIKSGAAIKEESSGVFNIKAGGALKQQGSNINLKGPTKVAGTTKITGDTKIKGSTLTIT